MTLYVNKQEKTLSACARQLIEQGEKPISNTLQCIC